MEALLSLAFDNLSSYDGPKIKKGLKQVEGLLAPICLSASRSKKRPTTEEEQQQQQQQRPPYKTLDDLNDDPAFFEFFKLQEGFEWNIAQRLLDTLDRLLSRGSDGQNDMLILNTLDLTQGMLLLHPPSKVLFSREKYMNLLLDLLEPVNCPAIQSATLLTLVVALIDTPQNTRAFEALDGLLTVTSIFKSRSTSREVKLKLVEFLYFYLMPETPSIPLANPRDSVPARKRRGSADDDFTRTTEEKQALLGRHLHNVDDLVRDLTAHTPFGGAVC
ncbi:cell division control protein 14 [Grosmannia clavigera kw1407]|uniref:Cell division control protein 14 n=1 Tax=Grosmannia clavigera (strain kw1407 / UAMH 11150) TaxID=655863 RepID=F0XER2_GROCL|nr:cell division control protein 14 [Grosmannia clavigera kw1407]EFX04054.1 cell division control protein 14 [Grosmannia clavigera kw1407]